MWIGPGSLYVHPVRVQSKYEPVACCKCPKSFLCTPVSVQVPALVSKKVCIVVSPLISLMEDQVAALTARGIMAAFLGSAQSDFQVLIVHETRLT